MNKITEKNIDWKPIFKHVSSSDMLHSFAFMRENLDELLNHSDSGVRQVAEQLKAVPNSTARSVAKTFCQKVGL